MKVEIMSGFVTPSSSTAFGSSSALPLPSSSNNDSSRCNNVRIRKESKYIANSRDDKLFSRIWFPGQEYPTPKGLVFICHGYGEHSQWYDKFCERLCSKEHGLICFSHDHLGHGLSEGNRATIPSIELYVDDVIQHVTKYKYKYRSLPFFIFGHSMGGLIALRVVQRNPGLFHGMVLMGPLIKLVEEVPTSHVFAARVANYVLPNFEAISFPLENITSDPDMLSKLKLDPFRWNQGIKISMTLSLYNAVQLVNLGLARVSTPFLCIHAEQDKLCSIEGSRQLHAAAHLCKDKSLIIFPEGQHNLFAEAPDIRCRAIHEAVLWIISRCGNSRGHVNIVDISEESVIED